MSATVEVGLGPGALDADRRWRWLLAGAAIPAIFGVFAIFIAGALTGLGAYELTAGLGVGFAIAIGVVAWIGATLAVSMAAAQGATTRPWLLLAGACGINRSADASIVSPPGLVKAAYGAAGVVLPDTIEEQYRATRAQAVDLKDVRPGDLMFWSAPASGPGAAIGAERICHVAITVGRGRVVSASPRHTRSTSAGVMGVKHVQADLIRWAPGARLHLATRPPPRPRS